MNLPFFEESNAIFTNYTFKEDHLKASQKLSGDNSRKIYAGVDVFGRGNNLTAKKLSIEYSIIVVFEKVFLLMDPRYIVFIDDKFVSVNEQNTK